MQPQATLNLSLISSVDTGLTALQDGNMCGMTSLEGTLKVQVDMGLLC